MAWHYVSRTQCITITTHPIHIGWNLKCHFYRREHMEMSHLKIIRRLMFIVSHVLGGSHSVPPLHPHK